MSESINKGISLFSAPDEGRGRFNSGFADPLEDIPVQLAPGRLVKELGTTSVSLLERPFCAVLITMSSDLIS